MNPFDAVEFAPDTTEWLKANAYTWYTSPRRFTITHLQNGSYQLFRFGSGLYSMHTDLLEAMQAAERPWGSCTGCASRGAIVAHYDSCK
jgi:hypothetical protein